MPRRAARPAMQVQVHPTRAALDRAAAAAAAECLRTALAAQGRAAAILASAASQVGFLDALTAAPGIDWGRVILFHMDEYLGIGPDHAASFRRFLRERVEARVRPGVFHYVCGEADEPLKECARYESLLAAQPIDLCCLGIGENGHIAFNDPHVADFQDARRIKLVSLDEACRRQQVGEGAFPTLESVPRYAYTLTIPALCGAQRMVCVVPEKRKAAAVRGALQGPISPRCPASILRQQSHATVFLDADSASQLDPDFLATDPRR